MLLIRQRKWFYIFPSVLFLFLILLPGEAAVFSVQSQHRKDRPQNNPIYNNFFISVQVLVCTHLMVYDDRFLQHMGGQAGGHTGAGIMHGGGHGGGGGAATTTGGGAGTGQGQGGGGGTYSHTCCWLCTVAGGGATAGAAGMAGA